MNRYVKGAVIGIVLASTAVYAATVADIIYWGYGGVNYAREWVDSTGRMNQQSMVNFGSTAVTLWPTTGARAVTDSISEITLYRTMWNDSTIERFNISAMANADGGAYRFGVEVGNGGTYRDMIFCFEGTSPGHATCPFKITIDGTFVSDDGGTTWRKL